MDKFPLAASGWRYLVVGVFLALVAEALNVRWLALPLWIFVYFFRILFPRSVPQS